MQQQYQKAIQDMTDRLQRLESQPTAPPPSPAAGAPTAPAPVATGALATAPRPSSQISALDLARPREPFALYERRGAGQLLLDIGVAGNVVGDFTLNSGGSKVPFVSFPGEANRFFPQEVEVGFFGQIDPYARAMVIFEAGEELDEGTGTRSFGVGLAEAWLELMALPFDTQVKAGLMRLDFGYLNVLHQHDRPFVDIPAVLQQFFGDEGLAESGFELKWLAAVLLADRSPHGAEHLRTMLVGSILAVRPSDVVKVASLYAAVGVFHWLCRRPFFLISMDPTAAFREGWRVRLWDFLFYASFGVVVTSSVRVAGVLLVFSYLIVPALAGIAVGGLVSTRLLVGWAFGTGVSVLGMLASALLDLPTGATVACMFGLLLLLWYSATHLRRAGGGVGEPSSHSIERAFSDKGAG